MKNPTGTSGQGGNSSQKQDTDPTLYCTAFKKSRFYIFSKREPMDNEDKFTQNTRDVFLEKPTKDDNQVIQVVFGRLGSVRTGYQSCPRSAFYAYCVGWGQLLPTFP